MHMFGTLGKDSDSRDPIPTYLELPSRALLWNRMFGIITYPTSIILPYLV